MADNNPALSVPASQGLQFASSKDETINGNAASMPDGVTFIADKDEHGWRRIVRNFSPSWFSVTMGTGIVALILALIPWKAQWLHYLSIVFFVLNVCLFTMAFTASLLRYTIWPEIWSVMIADATNSLFLGTIPMGFATLVDMWVLICVPAWGEWAAYVGFALWILDSVVAVTVTLGLAILLMSASHQRALDSITAAQLLPIAATIGTGSGVAGVLPNPQIALGTIMACYVMWGIGIPMAFSVMIIYYQRLALHKMPPREIIVSAFLPLGPLGFGGYTILNLGKMAMKVFPQTETLDPMAGKIAYVLGFFISLIMWGWGLLWMALALASIYMSRPFGFNVGWWGFTFPLGVYSVSTILIGEELPSRFFRVLGTVFGTTVIILWFVVAIGTARGAWTGVLFHAPCLANLNKKQALVERASSEEEKQVQSAGDVESSNDVLPAPQPMPLGRTAPDIEQ